MSVTISWGVDSPLDKNRTPAGRLGQTIFRLLVVNDGNPSQSADKGDI
jgi:hypothetical protein